MGYYCTMNTDQQKPITQKSAKQEIWEAYEDVLKEIARHGNTREDNSKTLFEDSERKKIIDKVSNLKVDKAIADINTLKSSLNDALNGLSDKIVDELKNLEKIKQVTKAEEERLENIYKIKVEVDSLLNLIEAKERKKIEFDKKTKEEEEKFKLDVDNKKKQNERDEEEYVHNLKMARKTEEYEHKLKQLAKEREFGEKMAVKENELKSREEYIIAQENEIKILKSKTEIFPAELEKVSKESAKKAKEETENQAKISKDMLEKDFAREKELAKFRIASLEDIMKKQTAQIQTLESQLAAANQKTQQLAVKIIETGGHQSGVQPSRTVLKDGMA